MCKPTNEKRLTKQNGITFGELKEFINSLDVVPNDTVVYLDVWSNSEIRLREVIADEEGITLYDWIEHEL